MIKEKLKLISISYYDLEETPTYDMCSLANGGDQSPGWAGPTNNFPTNCQKLTGNQDTTLMELGTNRVIGEPLECTASFTLTSLTTSQHSTLP